MLVENLIEIAANVALPTLLHDDVVDLHAHFEVRSECSGSVCSMAAEDRKQIQDYLFS